MSSLLPRSTPYFRFIENPFKIRRNAKKVSQKKKRKVKCWKIGEIINSKKNFSYKVCYGDEK